MAAPVHASVAVGAVKLVISQTSVSVDNDATSGIGGSVSGPPSPTGQPAAINAARPVSSQ